MIIRFYIDPDTSEPHIFEHGVSADEVREVLRKPLEEAKSRKHSIIALGQTRAGRYLKIIYSRDEDNDFCDYCIRPATKANCGPRASNARKTKMKKKDPNQYPKGLNRQKVADLIRYYEEQRDDDADRKSTRLNSSHPRLSRMPSSA